MVWTGKSEMYKNLITEALKTAEILGINVRYSNDCESGLCSIRGETILFINNFENDEKKLQHLITAFRNFDLEQLYIIPALREMIEERE